MAFFGLFFRRTRCPRAGTLLSLTGKNAGEHRWREALWGAVPKRKGHCGLHEAAFILVVLWIALDGGWLHSDNVLVLPMVTIALYFLFSAL